MASGSSRRNKANDGGEAMKIVPCDLAHANAYVKAFHRHHRPVVGAKVCLALADDDGTVHGVAIIGRPVSRHLDDGWTLEVTRLCTDGTSNACSMLYGAAWKTTRAMGYPRIITYTLASEGGASLRAAGWREVAQTRGGSWSCPSRLRVDHHPTEPKRRWEAGSAASVDQQLIWPNIEPLMDLLLEAAR